MKNSKKKLSLKKKTVFSLNNHDMQEVKGGKQIDIGTLIMCDGGFSSGCTDGCDVLNTMWNCTYATCTNDC